MKKRKIKKIAACIMLLLVSAGSLWLSDFTKNNTIYYMVINTIALVTLTLAILSFFMVSIMILINVNPNDEE